MRILLVTVGSTGDVRPYVALGRGLQLSGHEVTIATHACFEDLVTKKGFSFKPIYGDPANIIRSELGVQWLESSGSGLRFGLGLRKLLRMLAMRTGMDCWEAAKGKDLIIASRLAIGAAFHVAEKLRIPLIPAYLQPSVATREFPDIHMHEGDEGPLRNRISHEISMWFFWLSIQGETAKLRKDVLGLPKLSARKTVHRLKHLPSPTLVGISPLVIPKPADWGNDYHMTGYWSLPEPDWTPPPVLVDFLDSGSPPVCVGFGSMNNEDREAFTQTVIRSLRGAGCRGVFLTGWGGLAEECGDENIVVEEEVPHIWLYPQMKAVVHHAGAGTSAACMQAGIPAIPVPFFADQPYWSKKLFDMGLATAPIPRRELTQERLESAIRRAISDETLRAQARQFGDKIRNEDGVHNATAIINEYVGQGEVARLAPAGF